MKAEEGKYRIELTPSELNTVIAALMITGIRYEVGAKQNQIDRDLFERESATYKLLESKLRNLYPQG